MRKTEELILMILKTHHHEWLDEARLRAIANAISGKNYKAKQISGWLKNLTDRQQITGNQLGYRCVNLRHQQQPPV